ncbi:hypothetical protein [Kitasatospora sp. LaBMicrA B282]|uniref:hypothetical protein n=1 Tax=Kitasatospora sp. LaBMicrA B282 TaxID=3420949 RepID=UPI003D13F157
MPVQPPQSQDAPSGFDPGQESPQIRFGVWGDADAGPGVLGSSNRAATSTPAGSAIDPGSAVLGVNLAAQGLGVQGVCSQGTGVAGLGGGPGAGVSGTSSAGPGVLGASTQNAGVHGTSAQNVGVLGESGGDEAGVFGTSAQGPGVSGLGTGPCVGVSGTSDTGPGVVGGSTQGTGVAGASTQGVGVSGQGGGSSAGVLGTSAQGPGVLGNGTDGNGVQGTSANGVGVQGTSDQSTGVEGHGVGTGVLGSGSQTNGVGVYATARTGLIAQGPTAALFEGNVQVSGNLTKSGGGFRIDHPQDPANRVLSHSFVEAPERKNLYDGIATLDDDGTASVVLPGWFTALNTDLRYQLTALDVPAPGLHVARLGAAGSFAIRGGPAGAEVCWQVTGVRADAWARANPLLPEEDKDTEERGYYFHPELYGRPPERSLAVLHHPDLPRPNP